jgi:endogenous inhibitor of DNA gyrase (YacG/DUF329 family)
MIQRKSSKPNRASPGADAAQVPACPVCGKPRSQDYHPFCSKRCADVDLGRWLKGTYVIPGEPDADEDGAGNGDRIGDPSGQDGGRA